MAVIDHADTIPADVFSDLIGPLSLAALQNEGLSLRLRREVAEVTASARRVVERGDAERRRIDGTCTTAPSNGCSP